MAKFKLSRRRLLRGMVHGSSVVVGLPLLEAMLNDHGTALAGGAKLPLRFLSWYWGDGIIIPRWEPDETGPNYTLSEQLAPIGSLKNYVSVLTGLRNLASDRITHHEGMTAFNGYSFVPAGGLDTNAGGPTIDQLIADALAGTTPIRDIHVRVSKRESTDGDGGTTVLAMSHRGEPGNLIPQVPLSEPLDVWTRLFGEFVPKPDDSALRTSILDYVREDAARLRTELGTADQQRVDAHLQGVAELEAKIIAEPPPCTLPDPPTVTNTDVGGVEPISDVNRTMAELIAYAFSCDITRVGSFLFKKFVSATVFNEVNASEVHHSASHNGPDDANYQAGITYQMSKFAELLEVFSQQVEPDGGNLLDSTIIYASSDCSTGYSHSIERQPVMLAGTGRGYLVNPGIHYQATPWNGSHGNPNAAGNISDVLLTCLQAFDRGATEIGGGAPRSTSPLTDVIA